MRPTLLLLLAAACNGPSEPEGPPSLVMVTPTDGEVVCGDPLAIRFDVEQFELVATSAEPQNTDGVGHVDVSLNGQIVNMTAETDIELPDVEPGEYRLQVVLVNADHTPIDPYVGATVYFEVDPAACGE